MKLKNISPHGQREKYIYCIFLSFFFPSLHGIACRKILSVATFYLGKRIKNHASHLRLSNVELMKCKPWKLLISFALVMESNHHHRETFC